LTISLFWVILYGMKKKKMTVSDLSVTAKYVNPYTDFGFKTLFGEEANKDLLVDFLNQLLPKKHRIVNLTLKNPEKLGAWINDRKAIFDIYCENKKGSKFIVEMQKAKMKFFKDRSVFYTTFPIKEQSEKGEWDFQLKPVYCVAILDFTFDEKRKHKSYLSKVQLKDQYCRIFYDKLTYIFIEMPLFKKKENELENHFEKWLYFLKHLEDFETIPQILKEPVFVKGFEVAEIANFDENQLWEYEESLKVHRDFKGVVANSIEEGQKIGWAKGIKEGREEGIKEGREEGEKNKAMEMAKKLKEKGNDIRFIAEISGLTPEEIEKL
jgi:predicted transposase/invertase (TIGR01784 family)